MKQGILCALGLLASTTASASSTTVFSTDFESGLPPEVTAPGAGIELVQGWAGLGNGSYQFAGSFLRYTDPNIQETRLDLADLPPHTAVSIKMLLAVIDSWDGTELLEIKVDGQLVFSHWFQIATGDTSSYVPPPGGLLSSGTELGFSLGSWFARDRAYDLSVDPAFQEIPHTASTLSITWTLSATQGTAAENWQGGLDESWAIDGLVVDVLDGSTSAGGTVRAGSWGRIKAAYGDVSRR